MFLFLTKWALAAAMEENVDHPIAFELRRQAELSQVDASPGVEKSRKNNQPFY